jgi:high-affinity iron transporter
LTLRADLVRSDLSSARRDWLAAQLDWERVGASYDSFGPLGIAVDGLPNGLPGGVSDPGFIGLHRLEYGLWHGQDAATLLPIADRLTTDVALASAHLDDPDLAGAPTNLPLRAHEILEDALRDHLSGIDDEGAGAAFAETSADLDATRVVLGELGPLLNAHDPTLVPTATNQMNLLAAALQAASQSGEWPAPAATALAARQRIDAAMGQLLETLAPVPELLSEPAGGA